MTRKRISADKQTSDLLKFLGSYKDMTQEELLKDMVFYYVQNFIEPDENSEDVVEAMLGLYLKKMEKELIAKEKESE